MPIDAADVVAQFGSHYIDAGQNLQNVKKLLYSQYKTGALFQDRPQTGDYFRSTSAIMDSVIQPFQKAFTSKGTLKFEPNAFPLFQIKIDQSVFPDDITKSYLGFLANVADNERANWPLIRYIIEVHLIAAKGNDFEKKVSVKGKYVAPTPGTAGAAEDSMDGIMQVLKRYNTAGRLNTGQGPLSLGALATDPKDFCTQIEEWVDSMNPDLRDELDVIVMSQTLAVRYRRGKRLKYGLLDNYLTATGAEALSTIEDYPEIKVAGYLSHNGTDLIWATPMINRIRPIWKGQLANVFKVESYRREVSIFTDWWEALDFEVPELVIVNDSADLAAA